MKRGRKSLPLPEKFCLYCKSELVMGEGEQKNNFKLRKLCKECKLPYMRENRVGHFAIKSGDYFDKQHIWRAFNE